MVLKPLRPLSSFSNFSSLFRLLCTFLSPFVDGTSITPIFGLFRSWYGGFGVSMVPLSLGFPKAAKLAVLSLRDQVE